MPSLYTKLIRLYKCPTLKTMRNWKLYFFFETFMSIWSPNIFSHTGHSKICKQLLTQTHIITTRSRPPTELVAKFRIFIEFNLLETNYVSSIECLMGVALQYANYRAWTIAEKNTGARHWLASKWRNFGRQSRYVVWAPSHKSKTIIKESLTLRYMLNT